MATHSSILAWRIPRIEEPGRLQSVGSQRGGHIWSDLAHKRGLFCLWSLIQVDWVRWELPSRCCYFSVAHLCPTFCDAMDCSKSGFPVLYYLLEFAQTHVHWVSDAIQSFHPFSPLSPALNLSQHQCLLQWDGSLHQVAKALELQLQHQSFQWIFRIDFL